MEKKLNDRGENGIVFDIQRFSLHDGHGIRTLVFLKGCPLNCHWCTNPESQYPKSQLGYFKEKCVSCFRCVSSCPYGPEFKEKGKINWDECKKCKYHFNCVEACIYGARVIYGKIMSVKEVVDLVRRDIVFYKYSSGGVTLGGGEVTFQPEFSKNILKSCKELGFNTAIETCGYVSWKKFKEMLHYVDLLLFDIKHMDTKKHEEKTGAGNEIILENLKKASKHVKEVIIRFPLLPGFNDDYKNIEDMRHFIDSSVSNVKRIDILPYHSIGKSKSERIGENYLFKPVNKINDEKIHEIKKILEKSGIQISIGG